MPASGVCHSCVSRAPFTPTKSPLPPASDSPSMINRMLLFLFTMTSALLHQLVHRLPYNYQSNIMVKWEKMLHRKPHFRMLPFLCANASTRKCDFRPDPFSACEPGSPVSRRRGAHDFSIRATEMKISGRGARKKRVQMHD